MIKGMANPNYLNPIDRALRLRLDDVIINDAGDVKVLVAADDASAPRMLRVFAENLQGVEVTAMPGNRFELSAADPSPSEIPDPSEMLITARELVNYIAAVATLDLGMECLPAVGSDGKQFFPAMRLKRQAGSPSENFSFVLANVLLDRIETPAFEALNLRNASGGGIETEIENMSGETEYVSANFVGPHACESESAALTEAAKLAEKAAQLLVIEIRSPARGRTG